MRMETSIAVPDASGTPDASDAFSALAGAMRGELKRHCYRMMGGVQDAEDCVQETLLRGWREFAGLRDGAAGRPWLYSIATRVCLDTLRSRRRRRRRPRSASAWRRRGAPCNGRGPPCGRMSWRRTTPR
jgi:RNA polymerase sigma-70 factor (ECF subfamily)